MDQPSQRRDEVIDGRYRLIELLGRGGIGSTFHALSLEDRQEVALKELSLRSMRDWKVLELFQREARLLAQLQDPGIPRYIDAFSVEQEGNQLFYLVQDLAPGSDLARAVEAGWRPKEEEARSVATQVLGVLLYLHGLSPPVIHRDIKPQNLIRSESGQIFLVDFGSVRDAYTDAVLGGSTVVGTFGYMAPEQGQGQAQASSDLYGLGATLVYLITGKHPAELPRRRMKLNFRQQAQVSQGFARWLDTMIEPVAEERFASAQQALAALRASSARRLVGWRRWALALPLAALVVAAVLTVLLWRTDDADAPQLNTVAVTAADATTAPADAAVKAAARPDAAPRPRCPPQLEQQLRADHRRLLAVEPASAAGPLKAAAETLRQRDIASWWKPMEAMSKLREHRSRSSIPLLLELGCLHSDAPQMQARAARMLVILSGEEAPRQLWDAAECKTTPPDERLRLQRELIERWWPPRKATLGVDLARMSRARQLTALRAMTRMRAQLPLTQRAHRLVGYMGLAMVAAEQNRGESTHWHGLVESATRLDWYATERLPPPLLAPLLSVAAELPLRWDAITLLDRMYRARHARQLRQIVTDPRQKKALRLVALLALRRAGESPSPALLFSLIKREKDPRLRLPAVLALRYFPSPRSVAQLLALCSSSDVELRTAALAVLLHLRERRALPHLARLLPRSKDRYEARAAMWLLFFLKKEDRMRGGDGRQLRPYTSVAEAYVRALLAEPAEEQQAGRLRDALDGFWRATSITPQVRQRHKSGLLIDYEQPVHVPYLRGRLRWALDRWLRMKAKWGQD